MRELCGLDTDEGIGVLRVIVHDVVLDLGHVGETELAVGALVDDLSEGHGSMVTPGGAGREATLVLRFGVRRDPDKSGTRPSALHRLRAWHHASIVETTATKPQSTSTSACAPRPPHWAA